MQKINFEIFDPIVDFYDMRKESNREKTFLLILPMIVGILAFLAGTNNMIVMKIGLKEFSADLLNQLITVLALFISFSMAYLSVLLASSSESVKMLKETLSVSYKLHKENKNCSLYQVNANQITYTIEIEILFLLFIFIQKFVVCFLNEITIKILLCINIAIFVHILFTLLIVVKNMYYIFWKNK